MDIIQIENEEMNVLICEMESLHISKYVMEDFDEKIKTPKYRFSYPCDWDGSLYFDVEEVE